MRDQFINRPTFIGDPSYEEKWNHYRGVGARFVVKPWNWLVNAGVPMDGSILLDRPFTFEGIFFKTEYHNMIDTVKLTVNGREVVGLVPGHFYSWKGFFPTGHFRGEKGALLRFEFTTCERYLIRIGLKGYCPDNRHGTMWEPEGKRQGSVSDNNGSY